MLRGLYYRGLTKLLRQHLRVAPVQRCSNALSPCHSQTSSLALDDHQLFSISMSSTKLLSVLLDRVCFRLVITLLSLSCPCTSTSTLLISTSCFSLHFPNCHRRKSTSNSTPPNTPMAGYKSLSPRRPSTPSSRWSRCSSICQSSVRPLRDNHAVVLTFAASSGVVENVMPTVMVWPALKGLTKSRPPQGSLVKRRPSSPCTAKLARCQPGRRHGGYGLAAKPMAMPELALEIRRMRIV